METGSKQVAVRGCGSEGDRESLLHRDEVSSGDDEVFYS